MQLAILQFEIFVSIKTKFIFLSKSDILVRMIYTSFVFHFEPFHLFDECLVGKFKCLKVCLDRIFLIFDSYDLILQIVLVLGFTCLKDFSHLLNLFLQILLSEGLEISCFLVVVYSLEKLYLLHEVLLLF